MSEQAGEKNAPPPTSEDAGVDMPTAYYKRGRHDGFRAASEQIAQAIEATANVCNQGADWRWGLEHAARIARQTRVAPTTEETP